MFRENLIERAERYLDASMPIPLDLFAALHDEGVDVEELTYKHKESKR